MLPPEDELLVMNLQEITEILVKDMEGKPFCETGLRLAFDVIASTARLEEQKRLNG